MTERPGAATPPPPQDRVEDSRFRAMVEATGDFVGFATAEGRVLYVNPAGRRMIGLAPDADIGHLRAADLHPPECAARLVREAHPAAVQNGSWQGECVLQAADGSRRTVSISITAHLNAAGGAEGFSTIMHDITSRKQAEQRLLQSEQRLRLQGDVLLALMQSGHVFGGNPRGALG